MAKVRILGIDPGTARTGWGVIDVDGSQYSHVASGLIATPAKTAPAERLKQLSAEIRVIIAEHSPEHASIEKLFFNSNVTTAMAVSEARGVILLACAEADVQISEYTPMQIKQSVSAYGGASKDQVVRMVTRLLNLKKAPKPDDVADGLAAAICHAAHHRFTK